MLDDFRTLQYYISAAPVDPEDGDEYYTEGWAVLRQCALDGQHILNCGADITVPQSNGHPDEQAKAELKQSVYLSLSTASCNPGKGHRGQTPYDGFSRDNH